MPVGILLLFYYSMFPLRTGAIALITQCKEKLSVKNLMSVATVVVLSFWNAHPGFAQTSEEFKALRNDIAELKEAIGLQREIEALKDGQKAMQQDLQEIKTLLRAQPAAPPAAPQNIVLNVDGAPSKGEKTAKLIMVEFTDFQ